MSACEQREERRQRGQAGEDGDRRQVRLVRGRGGHPGNPGHDAVEHRRRRQDGSRLRRDPLAQAGLEQVHRLAGDQIDGASDIGRVVVVGQPALVRHRHQMPGQERDAGPQEEAHPPCARRVFRTVRRARTSRAEECSGRGERQAEPGQGPGEPRLGDGPIPARRGEQPERQAGEDREARHGAHGERREGLRGGTRAIPRPADAGQGHHRDRDGEGGVRDEEARKGPMELGGHGGRETERDQRQGRRHAEPRRERAPGIVRRQEEAREEDPRDEERGEDARNRRTGHRRGEEQQRERRCETEELPRQLAPRFEAGGCARGAGRSHSLAAYPSSRRASVPWASSAGRTPCSSNDGI